MTKIANCAIKLTVSCNMADRENILPSSLFPQLGEVMVSMASNVMLADERVLWMAQREATACSRIIACLQRIATYRLATAQAFSLVRPRTRRVLSSFVRYKTFNPLGFFFLLRCPPTLLWRPTLSGLTTGMA